MCNNPQATKCCCSRFQKSVMEEVIVHANDENDETEWLIAEWLHIYYCPFCGRFIKGKGWGEYAEGPFAKGD